jgi:hypothetical protein
MSKEIIQSELNKETPDWLLISNLSKEIYLKSRPSNPLNFKKGVISLIKCGEYTTHDVKDQLSKCFDSDDYLFLNISPADLTKLIKDYKSGVGKLTYDKYIIIITDSASISNKLITNGFNIDLYNATVRNKWVDKPTKLFIKGNGVDFSSNFDELKATIRDITLNSILN